MKRPVVVLAIVWVALTGCALIHPKAGDTCAQGDAICQPGNAAIVCLAGKYLKTSCGGPKGCAMASNRMVACDQTAGASADEPCLASYDGQVQCLADSPVSYVMCHSGTWERHDCADGVCKRAGDSIVCE